MSSNRLHFHPCLPIHLHYRPPFTHPPPVYPSTSRLPIHLHSYLIHLYILIHLIQSHLFLSYCLIPSILTYSYLTHSIHHYLFLFLYPHLSLSYTRTILLLLTMISTFTTTHKTIHLYCSLQDYPLTCLFHPVVAYSYSMVFFLLCFLFVYSADWFFYGLVLRFFF